MKINLGGMTHGYIILYQSQHHISSSSQPWICNNRSVSLTKRREWTVVHPPN